MRKKILSMSIAAVMTAITSTGVMAFDTNGHDDTSIVTADESRCDNMGGNANDGKIRAPEVTSSYRLILENRLRNDIPNITDAQIDTKINTIAGLIKCAGYQGNLLPQINGITTNTPNPHPPVQSVANLTISPNNNLGDALIFPMFNQAEDWGTEIVVRNTDQFHAIVAKVAVYAADRSEEVLDFNIYLSAADVVRFKIENGNLTSTDGSVLRVFPTPSSNVNDVGRSDWASKDHPFTHPISVDSGYIVVYGMAQASNENDNFDRFDMRYHHNHNDLFKNYRRELDACRPGWRNGHQNAMVNGTYTRHTRASQSVVNYSVAAPNQGVNCNLSNQPLAPSISAVIVSATNAARLASQITNNASAALALAEVQNMLTSVNALNGAVTNSQEVDKARKILEVAVVAIQRSIQLVQPGDQATPEELANIASSINDLAQQVAVAAAQVSSSATAPAPGNFFGDVDASLTGTVRLYNAANGARDMVLPATAIENFTSGNKIIYTEGEISALQDRKIQGFGINANNAPQDLQWAKYNELGIRADARALVVNNLSYNFAEASIANQLVITQPYKRVLVQLGNDDAYWQDADVGRDVVSDYWDDEDDNYGGYSFLYNVYDEHENIDPTAYTESPHNSGLFILKRELELMANLEEASTKTFFNNRQELGQNAEKNGFALFSFTNMDGLRSGIPAVVSQMIGTTVGGAPRVNWIYSQTRR